MKFLITNMAGFRNKGCEASTKAIIIGITKLQSDTSFRVLTSDPIYDALWMTENPNVRFLTSPFRWWYLFSKWWLYRLIAKSRKKGTIGRAIGTFQWANAVLSTGGDIFSLTYGARTFANQLCTIRVATSFKKPVILVGHSIGPFERDKERKAFVKTMQHVPLITLRESLSLEYTKSMDLKNTRIELTADPAFCLLPADAKNVQELWRIYHLPNDQPIIAVAPSQSIADYGRTLYNSHFEALEKLIKFLTNELKYHVILIPHCLGPFTVADDCIICDMLYRKLGFPENVTVISLNYSAEEIRGIIAKCDLLIAERMHAAIAGLSQAVPTLVVGYSVKGEGIIGDIFGFNKAEDYLIPITKLSEETLREHVENILEKRHEIAQYLSNVMPRVKAQAERNFTLTMDFLRN